MESGRTPLEYKHEARLKRQQYGRKLQEQAAAQAAAVRAFVPLGEDVKDNPFVSKDHDRRKEKPLYVDLSYTNFKHGRQDELRKELDAQVHQNKSVRHFLIYYRAKQSSLTPFHFWIQMVAQERMSRYAKDETATFGSQNLLGKMVAESMVNQDGKVQDRKMNVQHYNMDAAKDNLER
jgi:hypothetical protein